MARRTYPRFGSAERLDKLARCALCGEPAARRVDPQVSIFRGDDLVAQLCTAHVAQAKAVPAEIVAALVISRKRKEKQ